MSTNYRSRSLFFGIATVFAFTLLVPVAVTAEEEEADLAPIAAPVVVGASAEDVLTTRALVAQHALQSGDIGSMQEEHFFAIVAAAPSWDETSGYGALEASRATIGHPVAGITSEQTQMAAVQQSLQSNDLGSLQEDALLAVVASGQSWDETSGYGAVEASRAMIGHPATATTSEAALLARFRAVELSLSRYLGAD